MSRFDEQYARLSQGDYSADPVLDGIAEPMRTEVRKYQAAQAQSRKMSLTEAVTNSVVGIAISIAATFVVFPIVFGFTPTLSASVLSTAIFTVISIIRSYVMRRVFTYLHHVKGIN